MNRIFRAFVQPVIPICAVFLIAGCDNKAGNPASGGNGSTNDGLDAQTAQQQALQAVTFANDVSDGVDELANGDLSTFGADLGLSGAGSMLVRYFSGVVPEGVSDFPGWPPSDPGLRASEEFVWNGGAGVWILDFSQTESDASGSATVDLYASVQFLDRTGQPQMDPDEQTAAISFDMDMAMDLHAQEDGQTIDMELDFAMGMDVAGLPDGPYLVDSDGSMSGSMQWTGFGDEDLDVTFAMGWAMELMVPADGTCPTGNMTVSLDPYRLDATYDGNPTFDWQLFESGTLVDSGTESASCQVAAAAN